MVLISITCARISLDVVTAVELKPQCEARRQRGGVLVLCHLVPKHNDMQEFMFVTGGMANNDYHVIVLHLVDKKSY
jgi:hypothetical protein